MTGLKVTWRVGEVETGDSVEMVTGTDEEAPVQKIRGHFVYFPQYIGSNMKKPEPSIYPFSYALYLLPIREGADTVLYVSFLDLLVFSAGWEGSLEHNLPSASGFGGPFVVKVRRQ